MFGLTLSPRARADASLAQRWGRGSAWAITRSRYVAVTSKKILLGAEKVFAEKGFGSTAMADIAAEVQLPRSNLHYYFSTKTELYSAVLFDLLEV